MKWAFLAVVAVVIAVVIYFAMRKATPTSQVKPEPPALNEQERGAQTTLGDYLNATIDKGIL